MAPPPARPRIAQQASSALTISGAETRDGDGCPPPPPPARRPSVGNGGASGNDHGAAVGSFDPESSRHGGSPAVTKGSAVGNTDSARLSSGDSPNVASISSPSDPRPNQDTPPRTAARDAREPSGPVEAIEPGTSGGAVICADEGGAVEETAGKYGNGKDDDRGALRVDPSVGDNGAAASTAPKNKKESGAKASGVSEGSDSGVVPVEVVSVCGRDGKDKEVEGRAVGVKDSGPVAEPKETPAALLNGA